MDLSFLLIQALNGIQYGLLLFLVAGGLTLIFGVMQIINLAHGAFYMIGAYLAFWLTSMTGNLFIAIALAIPIAVLLGWLVERLTIRGLYGRDHLDQVLLTYGLILIFNEAQRVLWGNDVHGVAIPEILSGSIQLTETLAYPVYRVFISVVGFALAGAMYLLIQKTKLGQIIRAGAHDRVMVQALGIDIDRLFAVVFSMGAALAAFSGMIAAPIEAVYPGMGDNMLILSFVVVVIGGIGSVKGAFLGAMVVGLTDAFGKSLFPDFASFSVYGVMALVLLWRPQGLFGRTTR